VRVAGVASLSASAKGSSGALPLPEQLLSAVTQSAQEFEGLDEVVAARVLKETAGLPGIFTQLNPNRWLDRWRASSSFVGATIESSINLIVRKNVGSPNARASPGNR
jgi:hypothetical protein